MIFKKGRRLRLFVYYQRLMAVFLGSKRACHILAAGHDIAALVVQADDRLMPAHLGP